METQFEGLPYANDVRRFIEDYVNRAHTNEQDTNQFKVACLGEEALKVIFSPGTMHITFVISIGKNYHNENYLRCAAAYFASIIKAKKLIRQNSKYFKFETLAENGIQDDIKIHVLIGDSNQATRECLLSEHAHLKNILHEDLDLEYYLPLGLKWKEHATQIFAEYGLSPDFIHWQELEGFANEHADFENIYSSLRTQFKNTLPDYQVHEGTLRYVLGENILFSLVLPLYIKKQGLWDNENDKVMIVYPKKIAELSIKMRDHLLMQPKFKHCVKVEHQQILITSKKKLTVDGLPVYGVSDDSQQMMDEVNLRYIVLRLLGYSAQYSYASRMSNNFLCTQKKEKHSNKVWKSPELYESVMQRLACEKYAVISGPRGCGKSSFVRLYIEENKNEYDLILWVDSSHKNKDDLMYSIAQELLVDVNHLTHFDADERYNALLKLVCAYITGYTRKLLVLDDMVDQNYNGLKPIIDLFTTDYLRATWKARQNRFLLHYATEQNFFENPKNGEKQVYALLKKEIPFYALPWRLTGFKDCFLGSIIVASEYRGKHIPRTEQSLSATLKAASCAKNVSTQEHIGVVLCRVFDIKLHVIQVVDDDNRSRSSQGSYVVNHKLISKEGVSAINDDAVLSDIKQKWDNDILRLLEHGGHFVPILSRFEIAEIEKRPSDKDIRQQSCSCYTPVQQDQHRSSNNLSHLLITTRLTNFLNAICVEEMSNSSAVQMLQHVSGGKRIPDEVFARLATMMNNIPCYIALVGNLLRTNAVQGVADLARTTNNAEFFDRITVQSGSYAQVALRAFIKINKKYAEAVFLAQLFDGVISLDFLDRWFGSRSTAMSVCDAMISHGLAIQEWYTLKVCELFLPLIPNVGKKSYVKTIERLLAFILTDDRWYQYMACFCDNLHLLNESLQVQTLEKIWQRAQEVILLNLFNSRQEICFNHYATLKMVIRLSIKQGFSCQIMRCCTNKMPISLFLDMANTDINDMRRFITVHDWLLVYLANNYASINGLLRFDNSDEDIMSEVTEVSDNVFKQRMTVIISLLAHDETITPEMLDELVAWVMSQGYHNVDKNMLSETEKRFRFISYAIVVRLFERNSYKSDDFTLIDFMRKLECILPFKKHGHLLIDAYNELVMQVIKLTFFEYDVYYCHHAMTFLIERELSGSHSFIKFIAKSIVIGTPSDPDKYFNMLKELSETLCPGLLIEYIVAIDERLDDEYYAALKTAVLDKVEGYLSTYDNKYSLQPSKIPSLD